VPGDLGDQRHGHHAMANTRPASTGWLQGWTGPRRVAAAAAVIAGLVFGAGWYQLGRWRDDRGLKELQAEVRAVLSTRSNALVSALQRRLALLDGFHAFVELHPEAADLTDRAAPFAARLRAVVPGVRNLAVARGSSYIFVSPTEGNERVIGYDPLLDARREIRADTRRALEGRGVVLTGPTALVQGGVGLIARRAVRVRGEVWGLVAMVLDVQPILHEAGLVPPAPDLLVWVRVRGGPTVLDSSRAFSGQPVVQVIELPDGQWEMAGQPVDGWTVPLERDHRLWLASGLVLSLFPMTVVFVFTWHQRVRLQYQARTEALVEERTAALARTTVIVAHSPVILVRWRPDEDWAVEYVSDNITQFGYSAEDFNAGRVRWTDIVLPEDLERIENETERDRAAGLVRTRRDYRIRTADGAMRSLEERTSVVREYDGRTVCQGIVIDVTEQRQLEAQYRQAQKMEAVGQLAGGIAHDFNNLLQVISGFAGLALDDLPEGAPVRREVKEIEMAATRATLLVRQLLAFSRRQPMERRPIDLNDAVATLLTMLRRVIGEHIELAFAPGEAVPPVEADPVQIEQVLANLCVNARDAIPEGGRIAITTSVVDIGTAFVEQRRWARTGRFVCLAVSDTGPGIPPEIREHIFEPFFTTKDVGKGTGLGLATVYGIIKQHDGMIDVATSSKSGTTFSIYLPTTATF
jgi:PAS domain S-box-containing protein